MLRSWDFVAIRRSLHGRESEREETLMPVPRLTTDIAALQHQVFRVFENAVQVVPGCTSHPSHPDAIYSCSSGFRVFGFRV